MTKTVTFELSEEQAEFLHAEAERESRSVSELVGDLVAQRMDYDAWFRRKVQEGIDAADRGELIPHEEVVARSEARRAELLAKYGDT
jgi:predicted transcriptional regulator